MSVPILCHYESFVFGFIWQPTTVVCHLFVQLLSPFPFHPQASSLAASYFLSLFLQLELDPGRFCGLDLVLPIPFPDRFAASGDFGGILFFSHTAGTRHRPLLWVRPRPKFPDFLPRYVSPRCRTRLASQPESQR